LVASRRRPLRSVLFRWARDKASIVDGRTAYRSCRAPVDGLEIRLAMIKLVGVNKISPLFVEVVAQSIKLTLDAGIRRDDSAPQLVSFNEILGEMIKGTIELIVDPRIALVDANEDLAVRKVIPIERDPGASPDQNPVGSRRGREILGDPYSFIEHIVEELELGVKQQEEAHTRFVEDWP